MAIQNVSKLFGELDVRDELRSMLYSCKNRVDLIKCLEINHMPFSFDEFEEAINILHVQCQTQEAANDLFSKINWFKFLVISLPHN